MGPAWEPAEAHAYVKSSRKKQQQQQQEQQQIEYHFGCLDILFVVVDGNIKPKLVGQN